MIFFVSGVVLVVAVVALFPEIVFFGHAGRIEQSIVRAALSARKIQFHESAPPPKPPGRPQKPNRSLKISLYRGHYFNR